MASLYDLVPSWELSMRARKLAPNSMELYLQGVRVLRKWCDQTGQTFSLDRALVQAYMAEMLESKRLKPGSVESYLKGMKEFSKWCFEEGETDTDALAGIPAPKSDEVILPSVTPEQWEALMGTCDRTLRGVRDEAIFGLLRDTGLRASELVAIDLADVNMREQSILIRGKGGRDRYVGYSDRTAVALDRYIRARRKSKYAAEALFVSVSTPRLSYDGLRNTIIRRAEQAGLPPITPHMFRRFFAHEALDNDMSGSDLKALAGWRSYTMLEHYTKEHANRRALKSQRGVFEKRDR